RHAGALLAGVADCAPVDHAGIAAGGRGHQAVHALCGAGRDRPLDIDLLDLRLARIDFDIKPIPGPAGGGWLVDHAYRRAHRDGIEQFLDVLGVEPDAAVTDIAPDTVGLVGAVDSVVLPTEVHGEGAERILRARRHHGGQLGALGADRGWRIPRRVRLLSHHSRRAERRLPSDNPE